jgi:hypothetical protein
MRRIPVGEPVLRMLREIPERAIDSVIGGTVREREERDHESDPPLETPRHERAEPDQEVGFIFLDSQQ